MPYKQRYDAERRAQVHAIGVKRKFANQDRMWEYLTTHPCADCGETDPLVLEFDHLEPIGKRAARVMSLVNTGLAWRTVLAEIAKCDLVCANCHARRSAFRRRSWRWLRAHVIVRAKGQASYVDVSAGGVPLRVVMTSDTAPASYTSAASILSQ